MIKFLLGLIPGVGPLLSWLAGKLMPLAQSFFAAWANKDIATVQAQASAATALGTAGITADGETSRAWLAMMASFRVTQWLIAGALVPPIVHSGMVYLDSCPFPYLWGEGWWPTVLMHQVGSWHVPAAPGRYADQEWDAIKQLLGIQGGMAGALGVLHWLKK